MDGLSAVASVASVAAVGVQLSKSIYDVIATIKAGKEEIADIADNVSLLSVVLEELQDVLNHERLHFRPALEQNARSIVSRCEGIFKDIERHTRGSGNATVQKLTWYFKRERVKPLRASLEALKSTLNIVLHVIQLAKATQEVKDNRAKTSSNWIIKKERRSLVLNIMENQVDVTKLKALEGAAISGELENDVDHLSCIYDGSGPLPDIFQRKYTQNRKLESFGPAVCISTNTSRSEDGIRRSRSRHQSRGTTPTRSHSQGRAPTINGRVDQQDQSNRDPVNPERFSRSLSPKENRSERRTKSQDTGSAEYTSSQILTSTLILGIIPHEEAEQAFKSLSSGSESDQLKVKAEYTTDKLLEKWTNAAPSVANEPPAGPGQQSSTPRKTGQQPSDSPGLPREEALDSDTDGSTSNHATLRSQDDWHDFPATQTSWVRVSDSRASNLPEPQQDSDDSDSEAAVNNYIERSKAKYPGPHSMDRPSKRSTPRRRAEIIEPTREQQLTEDNATDTEGKTKQRKGKRGKKGKEKERKESGRKTTGKKGREADVWDFMEDSRGTRRAESVVSAPPDPTYAKPKQILYPHGYNYPIQHPYPFHFSPTPYVQPAPVSNPQPAPLQSVPLAAASKQPPDPVASPQSISTQKPAVTPAPAPSQSVATISSSQPLPPKTGPSQDPSSASLGDGMSPNSTSTNSTDLAFAAMEKFMSFLERPHAAMGALEAKHRQLEEEVRTQAAVERLRREAVAAAEAEANSKPITLQDCLGRRFVFPIEMCRSWSVSEAVSLPGIDNELKSLQAMEVLVKQRFDPNGPIGLKIYEKEYHILSPTGDILLPETWERLIKPGWVVEMRLWSEAENQQKGQGSRSYLSPSISSSTVVECLPSSPVVPPKSPNGQSIASSTKSSMGRKRSSIRSWFRGRRSNYSYEDD